MSKLLTEFSGNRLYLDTMVPYALLRGLESTAQRLFERIHAGEIVAYSSVLTFDELAYRLLLALIKDQYQKSPLDRLRADEEGMISLFYPRIAPKLTQLRNFPNLNLVDVTPPDIEAMSKAMLQYHLRPRDALHLVAMQKSQCWELVSNDAGFDRVPTVQRYVLT
ncbi:type II toxin-antitoxin system VapC family toxin [Anaerolineales bacterium HSG25]|nr:type II toxin-antitoxin system VapC family toxin [Anaerolineales bacterium HSG25]